MFLLRPSPLNTQIFIYCLAVAVKKTGIEVHAIVVLSNHGSGGGGSGKNPVFVPRSRTIVGKIIHTFLKGRDVGLRGSIVAVSA